MEGIVTDLTTAKPPTTLAQARDAFRQTPNSSTALAYMDAAIAEWEATWVEDPKLSFDPDRLGEYDRRMHDAMMEIRDWLMNARRRDPALWPEGAESQ